MKKVEDMKIQYTHFKRFNKFSIGGTSSAISKNIAKSLITKFNGKVKREFSLAGDCRIIELSNRNRILIHLF